DQRAAENGLADVCVGRGDEQSAQADRRRLLGGVGDRLLALAVERRVLGADSLALERRVVAAEQLALDIEGGGVFVLCVERRAQAIGRRAAAAPLAVEGRARFALEVERGVCVRG